MSMAGTDTQILWHGKLSAYACNGPCTGNLYVLQDLYMKYAIAINTVYNIEFCVHSKPAEKAPKHP